jgi:hypothetical protein
MNGKELEFPDKRKTNAALKDNIDRFTDCSGEIAIPPDDVCKYNKEKPRKEHFYLLNQELKVLVII